MQVANCNILCHPCIVALPWEQGAVAVWERTILQKWRWAWANSVVTGSKIFGVCDYSHQTVHRETQTDSVVPAVMCISDKYDTVLPQNKPNISTSIDVRSSTYGISRSCVRTWSFQDCRALSASLRLTGGRAGAGAWEWQCGHLGGQNEWEAQPTKTIQFYSNQTGVCCHSWIG